MALALCAWLGTASAYSRMGDAEVRLQDGQPCFTLTAKEAARGATFRLQAVGVSDASSKPPTEVWSIRFDLERLPLMSPASCIAYGQTPSGAADTSAVELQAGKFYTVHLPRRCGRWPAAVAGKAWNPCMEG